MQEKSQFNMQYITKTSISDRIQRLIDEYEGGVKTAFANKTGMGESRIRTYLNGTQPTAEALEKIVRAYAISSEWLITGEGDMVPPPPSMSNSVREMVAIYNKTPDHILEEQLVPLYSIEATAGILEQPDNAEYIKGNIFIPGMPKCDGALHVTGYSMQPLLENGDIVAVKRVHDLENIHYGDMYLISINEDGDNYTAVKWLHKNQDNPDTLTLISHNPNYAPRDVHMSAIRDLALVKFSIRYNTMY